MCAYSANYASRCCLARYFVNMLFLPFGNLESSASDRGRGHVFSGSLKGSVYAWHPVRFCQRWLQCVSFSVAILLLVSQDN
eukprot:355192-Amphidinium_carterae.1